ncbi:tripartite tricarboxylate transporter TctB family protein [Arsenicitalea aurantiaca]|nr:tripartite tricarboxylate transporter TctB family protein [Arsenicitalea aurantiaca]
MSDKGLQTKILAAVLIAFSALIFWGTLNLAPSPFEPLGASAFPRFIAVLVAIFSIGLVFMPSEREEPELPVVADPAPELAGPVDDDQVGMRATPVMALATVGCTIVYAIALQARIVSFAISTAIFLLVLMTILTRFNPRAMPLTLVMAVVFGFGLEYVFTSVFVVNLP